MFYLVDGEEREAAGMATNSKANIGVVERLDSGRRLAVQRGLDGSRSVSWL